MNIHGAGTMAEHARDPLKLSPAQRALELARPWVLLAIYALLAAQHRWLFAIPVAAITCFAAFVQMHDAIHASLGLSKRVNDAVLAMSGLLLLEERSRHARHPPAPPREVPR